MDGYLFDPHTHTAETSKCGHLPAAEVVDRYVRHGFSGLVVTDHLHPEYLSRIDTDHDWNKVIDHYLSGYRASKQRGDEVGFQVLLGAELRFPENDNDYLVYGIDEAWLRSNPYVCCMSAREFFQTPIGTATLRCLRTRFTVRRSSTAIPGTTTTMTGL